MHSCFELVIIGYPSDTDTVLGPSPQDINFQANSRHLMLLNKYQYLLSRNKSGRQICTQKIKIQYAKYSRISRNNYNGNKRK